MVRIDAGRAAGRRAVKATRLARIWSLFLRRWYYFVFQSITPQIEYHIQPHGNGEKRIILLLNKYLERDDVRDIEGPSVSGIVRGKQEHAAVERRRPGRAIAHGKRKLRCNPAVSRAARTPITALAF